MKVLFSIYYEDHTESKENITLIKKEVIETNWDYNQMEAHFGLYDQFRSEYIEGENCSFYDIFCMGNHYNDVVRKLESIERTVGIIKGKKISDSGLYYIVEDEFTLMNYEALLNSKYRTVYQFGRFECGASSLYGTIILIISNPISAIFIGGLVWDFFKLILSKVLYKLFPNLSKQIKRKQQGRFIIFNSKKFYKKASLFLNKDKKDLQITGLRKLKKNMFRVDLRTISGEMYLMKCTRKGDVLTVKSNSINNREFEDGDD